MVTHVIKRDGTKQKYSIYKIITAVSLAFNASKTEIPSDIAEEVKENVENELSKLDSTEVDIEYIQDLVVKFLETNYPDVGKHYKKVRAQRERARSKKSKILLDVREKLDAKNIENQNANVDEMSFGGREGEATSVLLKDLALNEYMPQLAVNLHLSNIGYTHDINSYASGKHNCLTDPIDDMLEKGFKTKQTDVRPANSVSTAAQLIAVHFQVQSLQQFGGISASHIDWSLAPYVRCSFRKHYNEICEDIPFCSKKRVWMSKEETKKTSISDPVYTGSHWYNFMRRYIQKRAVKRTERETYQSIEGMYHNLNTLQSRSGNQLPFTSINYGTCTLPEGRMVIKAILEISIKGLGSLHKTPIFPCGIFQYWKGVNDKPGTPNYDLKRLALKSTSQRLYPNYANVDWSGNAGFDPKDPRTYFSTMGCRTANGWDINGFGQLKDGRGNIAPFTLILPTIAMEAKLKVDKRPRKMSEGDLQRSAAYVEQFMQDLDGYIDNAKDCLIDRFEWICSQPMESARFMYENGNMAGYIPEEGIRSALKHGTLAIGQLGLAETLQILIGTDHTTKWGMDLAKRIEQLFKDRCAEYKEKYKLNFGVYYTPAENLCYTAMKKFQDKYGKIPNVSDREYFTNSMHVPVWKKMNAFEKIDIESQLTGYSSAGCITYVELPSSTKNNIDALEAIVDYAMDKDIPYFAINVPNDQCMDCGYIDEIGETCPICGGTNINRLRRVTGYLSSDYRNFNLGKQAEVEDRVKHEDEIKSCDL